MRRATAIVWSVLITLTLLALPREATSKSLKCPCCACSEACCVGQSAPAPTPVSAAPSASVSLKQICSAPVVTVVETALLAPLPFPSSSCSSFLKAGLVPLYERNCAYLI